MLFLNTQVQVSYNGDTKERIIQVLHLDLNQGQFV